VSIVVVKLRDGSQKRFDSRRAGGSYGNSVRYEGAFAIVKDPYANETAYPAQEIEQVYYDADDRGW